MKVKFSRRTYDSGDGTIFSLLPGELSKVKRIPNKIHMTMLFVANYPRTLQISREFRRELGSHHLGLYSSRVHHVGSLSLPTPEFTAIADLVGYVESVG